MANILIVEDDRHIRNFLSDLLIKEGHMVATAQDGSEALNLIEEISFQCIITDILMPGVEGIELIVELRKFHPSIKVIAISGGGQVDKSHYLDMASEFGADRMISKPFNPQKIVDTVDVLLWEKPSFTR